VAYNNISSKVQKSAVGKVCVYVCVCECVWFDIAAAPSRTAVPVSKGRRETLENCPFVCCVPSFRLLSPPTPAPSYPTPATIVLMARDSWPGFELTTMRRELVSVHPAVTSPASNQVFAILFVGIV